jgi:hypothetical protein
MDNKNQCKLAHLTFKQFIGLVGSGFVLAVVVMAVFFYLFALPFLTQNYQQAYRAGLISATAHQNSTVANALVIAMFTCYNIAHQNLLTTNGISQFNETNSNYTGVNP